MKVSWRKRDRDIQRKRVNRERMIQGKKRKRERVRKRIERE